MTDAMTALVLRRCPECDAYWVENDINNLDETCPGCGETETEVENRG